MSDPRDAGVQGEFDLSGAEGSRTERLPLPGGGEVRVRLNEHPRARRYSITVLPEGGVRLTVPRRGSRRGALEFARSQAQWIERQIERLAHRRRCPAKIGPGDLVMFRGERVAVGMSVEGGAIRISLDGVSARVKDAGSDLTAALGGLMRAAAERELVARARELAALHGCAVARVAVRNLKASWGRCAGASRRAVAAGARISLNWRLVQAPPEVRDYVILHELMHTREMNHSRRFWAEVAKVCPNYRAATRWLRDHRDALLA